jgi:hypothetical protein
MQYNDQGVSGKVHIAKVCETISYIKVESAHLALNNEEFYKTRQVCKVAATING